MRVVIHVLAALLAVGAQSTGSSPDPDRLAAALLEAAPDAREPLLTGATPEVRGAVVTALTARSEQLRRTSDFTRALAASRLAVELAEPLADPAAMARALTSQGAVHTSRGELAEALGVLTRSRELARTSGNRALLADALEAASSTHFIQGNNPEAVASANEALALRRALGEPGGIAKALTNVAMADRQRSELDRAVTAYEEAIRLATKAGDDFVLARVLNNIAVAERERGYNERAIDYYQRSLAINQRIGSRAAVANTLSNLGMSYQDQGLNDVALDHFVRALATLEEVGDRRNIAQTLGNIGFLYRQQGNDALALEYYRRSLAVSEAIGHRDGISRIVDFMARMASSKGHYEEADRLFARALEIRQEMNDRAGIANVIMANGFSDERRGDYDRALARYREGHALFEQIGERRSLSYSHLRLAGLHNKRREYREALAAANAAAAATEATGQQARTWATELAIGRAQRGLGDPMRAREAFDRAIAGIERLREQVAGGEEDRQRAFEQQVDPYHEMVTLLADAGDAAGALTYAELAKGRVLLDVLRYGRVNVTKAMSDGELDEERRMNAAIVTAAAVLQRERQRRSPDQARIADLERAVESARGRADSFRVELYGRHPELRARRSETPPIAPDELRGLVADGTTALIEYVVTRTGAYAFVVTTGDRIDLSVHRIDATPETLERQIDEFRTALERRELGFRAQARALYTALVGPIVSRIAGRTRLVIVPEGPLWDLPFQALLGADGRFLVERVTLSTAPSLTALREERRATAPAARAVSLVAFGDPANQPATPGAALGDEAMAPRAGSGEVTALRQLYGSKGRVFTGRDATEARFKAQTGAASILHFSTHGILNNVDPMSSHLVLAPSADGTKAEDGRLQAREIFSLDLDSDLVVLSGCDTARGRVGVGEGVIGLTWAFFVAGVPTTVVSQWRVDSESTSRLMVGLHQRLSALGSARAARTPADALRSSALAMLATDRYRHPFYWAGFTVVGDGLRDWR